MRSPAGSGMGIGAFLGLVIYGMTIGVALAAPIGPINIEIVRRGIQGGFRHGWLVGLGALTADTVYAALIVSGLTPVADSPTWRVPLFLAGAVMLGWVGFTSLRTALHPPPEITPTGPPARGSRSYVTGFLMALFNPMGIVYWLSVGAALVAEAVERVGRAGSPVLVGGVFFGIFCWVTLLSWLAQVSRRFVTGDGMRWVTGTGGVVLMGFGVWFLVQAWSSLT